MTEQYKNRVVALLITILFHIIFICCFYLVKIGYVRPIDTDKKTFVEIAGVVSNKDLASSSAKASESSGDIDETNKQTPLPKVENKEPLASSNTKVDTKVSTTEKVLSKNSSHSVDSTSIRKKVDDKISLAFSKKQGSNTSGVSSGSVDRGNGQGGNGLSNIGDSGAGYSLAGRSILGGGSPVRPNTSKPVFGKIVIGILVNGSGDVVDAWVDINGTQISDSEVRNAAIVAAKATKFNSINTSNNQRGKIIYNFKVK